MRSKSVITNLQIARARGVQEAAAPFAVYRATECDLDTVEINLDNTAIHNWKINRSLVTFCHGGSFLSSSLAH
jgi:hypothetical protein